MNYKWNFTNAGKIKHKNFIIYPKKTHLLDDLRKMENCAGQYFKNFQS